ncbi:ABC transporter permease [Nonomuraea sp. B5E05]|uniref:ABC transporter permease n=1 Tax=Nonomuraea sp. B5E05 TaxID=3153569 RepID=UPI003261A66D
MPAGSSAFFIYQHEVFAALGSLGYIAAIVMFSAGAFGLYTTAASDTTILSGLLLPIIVISLVQVAVIMTALAVVTGEPDNVLLLAAAVVSMVIMMLGLGLATAGLTNSPEHAQVTTLPISLGTIAVASWVGIAGTEELTLLKRLLPGGSATELVLNNAWNGGASLADSLIPGAHTGLGHCRRRAGFPDLPLGAAPMTAIGVGHPWARMTQPTG